MKNQTGVFAIGNHATAIGTDIIGNAASINRILAIEPKGQTVIAVGKYARSIGRRIVIDASPDEEKVMNESNEKQADNLSSE